MLVALICTPASAQSTPTLVAPFSSSYSVSVLETPVGVPTNFGGLTIKAGSPNTLLIGGSANQDVGALYAVQLARDSTGHVSGIVGTATRYAAAEFNEGGVTYGPGGNLFLARWPSNELGQLKPGSTVTNKVIPMAPLGVEQSLSSLAFVPPGAPGAGRLKLASYGGGAWYDAGYAPDGNGTYNVTGVKEITASRLAGGPEGFVYVNRGSPGFSKAGLIVAEYSLNEVAVYDNDGAGNPVVSSRRTFITGLDRAEGATIDPQTGDFLFSTFGGGNRVVVVRGFSKPPPPPVAGKKVNAVPVSGTVKIKEPGKKGFKALKAGDQIPVGTTVDTTKGRVTLVTAGARGTTDQADFYDGLFKIGQSRKSKLTTLTLVQRLACTGGGGRASAAAKKKKKKRRLWGDGKGKFRTKGQFSSATVRGTKWLVEDTCSTTLTRVARGTVTVRDFAKRKNVIVKAGKKYVARKR